MLPDVIAELAERSGGPFVVEFPAPLPDHAMRLMATLGAEVRVVSVYVDQTRRQVVTGGTPVAPPPAVSFGGPARRISAETCAKCPDTGRCLRDKFCWRAQLAERLLVARAKAREDTMGSGLEALERMDAGERQAPDAEANGARPRGFWTQGRIIEAIQRWAAEHDGQPPTQRDWKNARDGYPAFSTAATKFTGWGASLRAAGFEPQPARRSAAVKPPPAEKPRPAVQPDPARGPDRTTAPGAATIAELAARYEDAEQRTTAARDEANALKAELLERLA